MTNGPNKPLNGDSRKPDVTFDHWTSKNETHTFHQSGDISNKTPSTGQELLSSEVFVKESYSNGKVSALRAIYQEGCNGTPSLASKNRKAIHDGRYKVEASPENGNSTNMQPFRSKFQNGNNMRGHTEGERVDVQLKDDLCRGVWSNGSCMTSDLLF